ncbi:MAG: UvrD-helicase domain-containing protein [Pseudomonadota bacterium]|nr:UvrD-helicase domain-containing protein [Pseudomonadota bacterium]
MPESSVTALNPQQLQAVTLDHESALILAGAGSGKTRVLTSRINWLLHTGKATKQEILAVTFTNKAAKEMLIRLGGTAILNRTMWVGTFHGLCNRFLRLHHVEAGYPASFLILDMADQLSMVKRIIKTLKINEEKYAPRKIQHYINAQKESGIRAGEKKAETLDEQIMLECYAAYESQCLKDGVADFAELLLRTVEILRGETLLRKHYQERFRYILVDEFQDTSLLQYEWLKLLSGKQNAVFAVGDDDQSIYGFRGANSDNIRLFEVEFNLRHIIRLEQNYRSQGNILDAANSLISHNQKRFGKNLWTEKGAGEPIQLHVAINDMEEAQHIVDEIRHLHRAGLSFSDMALLYRSNAQSRILEHTLFNAGLAYKVYGGLRFFERAEIKHALAYLRLSAGFNDNASVLRIINFPARGIGSRSLEILQETALAHDLPLMEVIQRRLSAGKTPIVLERFLQVINTLRQKTAELALPESIERVIVESGLYAYYENEKEGRDQLDNLNELVNAASLFQAESDTPTLEGFLAHAALEAGDYQLNMTNDAIQLMTVHAAKGLEFEIVFVSGLEEGLFPHDNSRHERDGIEEERRLMYVAMTRAKQKLYLSYAQTRMLNNQRRCGIRSRFLNEIPESLIHATNSHGPGLSSLPMPSSNSEWGIGQKVIHPVFGAGEIMNVEGRGDTTRVLVGFKNRGSKWLAVSYAKLSRA